MEGFIGRFRIGEANNVVLVASSDTEVQQLVTWLHGAASKRHYQSQLSVDLLTEWWTVNGLQLFQSAMSASGKAAAGM